MAKKKRLICVCFIIVAMLVIPSANAQTVGMEYTTEMHSDFSDKANWVNQLRLEFSAPLGERITVRAATLSMGQTYDGSIMGDLQTFSNLEAGNIPLALAVAGVEWTFGRSTLFGGVRTVPEDYFASPVTGFFTNSSCGIFPTISANYPIPNYPFAGVGIHYAYEGSRVTFQTSIYNGTGSDRFTGRNNVFRVCPQSDGVFAIGDVQLRHDENRYFLGYSGVKTFDADSNDGFFTLWGYAEQQILPSAYLLVSASHCFNSSAECLDFAGGGAKVDIGDVELGVFSDYARFQSETEWATEFSCKIPLSISKSVESYLQPTVHLISNDSGTNAVGMLRFGIAL